MAVRLRNKCIELKTRLCLNSREIQVRVDGMPQQKNLTISLSHSELEVHNQIIKIKHKTLSYFFRNTAHLF